MARLCEVLLGPPKALRASTFTASYDTEKKRFDEEGKFLKLARRHRGLVYIGERI